VFINVRFSSIVFSIIGVIIVESDDGILVVGRNEVALSLLELSVIVDDSANDNEDCVCGCISTESVIDDDVCISIDSAIDVFSSSLILCSVATASDCVSEEI
jgi:hypothetical protein